MVRFFLITKRALVRDFRDYLNFCTLLFLVKKKKKKKIGRKWGI